VAGVGATSNQIGHLDGATNTISGVQNYISGATTIDSLSTEAGAAQAAGSRVTLVNGTASLSSSATGASLTLDNNVGNGSVVLTGTNAGGNLGLVVNQSGAAMGTVVNNSTALTGGSSAGAASTLTLQDNQASVLTAGTPATGQRGLSVDATPATGMTTLTGGDAGVATRNIASGMAAGTPLYGAGLTLQGANASLINNTGHGMQVTATQTVISGGSTSTSLRLSNGGAAFSNSSSGAPVRVTGVADGTTSFDAVNYQQLKALEKKMSQGVASTTAIANIPQVDQDKTFAVGMGVANFNGETALAVGMTYRPMPNAVLKASVSAGSGQTVFGGGAAMSF
jgi:hypothetical protein